MCIFGGVSQNWGLETASTKKTPHLSKNGGWLAPQNLWLEDDPFLLGPGNFSGAMLNFGMVFR